MSAGRGHARDRGETGPFDLNVALGRFAGGDPAFDDADALRDELRRLGIGGALVYHAAAAEADVQAGNALLVEQLRGHDGLHPCWVMAPPYLQDVPQPRAWARQARDAGVRAVRLFPRHHLYDVREWCIGELCAALEDAALPLLLDFGPRHWSEPVVPWDGVREVARAHPALPIVLVGANIGDVRPLSALLRELPNLHIETHAFIPPDALEQFAEAGLADRLLFGTGLPRRAAECAVGQLRAAAVGDDAFCAIAAGNAARLLRLDVTPTWTTPAERRHGFEVIDVHAHIGSWERTTTPIKGPRAFLASMDRCGVAKMVFSSFTAIHGETRTGNDETARAIAQGEGRLFGYAVVNPNSPYESLTDLARLFDGPSGFVGLKLHCQLHGAQLHDAGYAECLAFADTHALPVLVHGGGEDRWDEVACAYPGANFIVAHACAWDGRAAAGRALYERVRTTPNLHVDVAGSAAHRGALQALIDLVGPEKILYGSDFPMFDLGFEVGRVAFAEVPCEQKRSILSENARRLFGRMV